MFDLSHLKEREPDAVPFPFSNARFVRVMPFTLNDKLKSTETKVNNEIVKLVEQGNKIISIVPSQVGTAPIYLVYTIIYEHNPFANKGN